MKKCCRTNVNELCSIETCEFAVWNGLLNFGLPQTALFAGLLRKELAEQVEVHMDCIYDHFLDLLVFNG